MDAMTVHIEDVLLWAVAQNGDRYVFGAEASAASGDPEQFDCSELVEWASARAKVEPKVPDGAVNQYAHCRLHGTLITVAEARRVRGALLFSGPGFRGGASGRSAIHHVGFSLGNDTTIEARGSKWGVGTWSIGTRFDFAGHIPGVDYTPRHQLPPVPTPEDYMPIGLDINDDRKGVVDQVCLSLLGNTLSDTDRDLWVVVLATKGYEALVNGIAGTPEGRARRVALRKLVGGR